MLDLKDLLLYVSVYQYILLFWPTQSKGISQLKVLVWGGHSDFILYFLWSYKINE